MAPGAPIRTVLVVGQTLLRQLLANVVAADRRFALLAEAGDAREAAYACQRSHPDLVVVDIDLPQADGIDLARRLVRRVHTRVLALSQQRDPVCLNRLHEIRVHGFVEKDQPLEIALEAMLEVGSGRTYFTAALCHTRDRLRADPDAFTKILTGREQDILRHVIEGRTSRDIAHRLNLSPRSVETFRYRLMRKLEIGTLAGLIEFAFRRGLIATTPALPGSRHGRTR